MDLKAVGQRIKSAREAKNLTQEELAALVNLSPTTTPEEVRREMQIAIDAGFDNPDPAVQEEWKKMTLKGDRPTPEEVINYAVKQLKGN